MNMEVFIVYIDSLKKNNKKKNKTIFHTVVEMLII